MKSEGALRMRFGRPDGIYRSDVSFLLFTPGACPAFRSGRCQGIGHAGKNMPCPSSAMSSGRLFLDRGARQHCPSPLHQQNQNKTIAAANEIIYHRTANCLLTVCFTRGDKPIQYPSNHPRKGPPGARPLHFTLSWRLPGCAFVSRLHAPKQFPPVR